MAQEIEKPLPRPKWEATNPPSGPTMLVWVSDSMPLAITVAMSIAGALLLAIVID
jgi:hypothetical protein